MKEVPPLSSAGGPPPFQLTPEQRGVVDALTAKQTVKRPLASWYLGAIRVLTDGENPDRVAQAAHSLRELLEKMPQVLRGDSVRAAVRYNFAELRKTIRGHLKGVAPLYPQCDWRATAMTDNLATVLTQTVDYLEKSRQFDRPARVTDLLSAIDPLFDSLAPQTSRKKAADYREVWKAVQNLTHHLASDLTIEKCLEFIEAFVLDHVGTTATDDHVALIALLKNGPQAPGAAAEMERLLARRGANFKFFIAQVDDQGWLTHLEAGGHFQQPPKAIVEDDEFVRWPYWQPTALLIRLAPRAEAEVVRIIHQIPGTENPLVLHEIAEVARAVPSAGLSLSLAQQVRRAAQLQLNWQDQEVFDQLVVKWAKSGLRGGIPQALRLTEERLQIDELSKEYEGNKPKHGELYAYRQFVDGALCDLANAAPLATSELLVRLVRACLDESIERNANVDQPWLDGTSTWCHDVGEPSAYENDPRCLLVSALTRACAVALVREPDAAGALADLLEKPAAHLLRRVLYAACAMHPAASRLLVARVLREAPYYGKVEHDAEFHDMVRAAVKEGGKYLEESEMEEIAGRILAGPNEKDFDVSESPGTEPADAWKKFARRFQLRQLGPFREWLSGKARVVFNELSDEGKSVPPDSSYRMDFQGRGGTVRQLSPLTTDELGQMKDEALAAYLGSWDGTGLKDNDFLQEISFRGLATAFEGLVVKDPARFVTWAERWNEIRRPIYHSAVLAAATALVKSNHLEQVATWLGLCQFIVDHEVPVIGPDVRWDAGQNWNLARQAVGDFLSALIEVPGAHGTGEGDRIWSLIAALCTGPDPDLEASEESKDAGRDVLFEALNRPRTRALQLALDASRWAGRADRLADLLAKRWAGQPPLARPEHAVLGASFADFFALDAKWALREVGKVFPREDEITWTAAFGSYVMQSRAFEAVWPAMEPEFRYALNHLKALAPKGPNHHRDAVALFGQHIFLHYAFGQVPLKGNGSLLESYLNKVSVEKRAELFGHVGSLVRHAKKLRPEVIQRIEAFFEERMTKQDSNIPGQFSLWLSADSISSAWRLDAFLRVLDLPDADPTLYSETDTLAALVGEQPARAMACFAKVVRNAPRVKYFHLPKDDVQTILKAGFVSPDGPTRANARSAYDDLIKLGRHEYIEGLTPPAVT